MTRADDKVSESMPFASLGTGSAIGSSEHNAMNYEMALQGHILLRNEKAMLPLDTTKRTFLVGPMSGGYQCQSGYETASEGCSSLSSSLAKAANWTNFSSASATDVNCPSHSKPGQRPVNCTAARPQLEAAIAEAGLADQIVLAVGIDQSITGEGRDRTNITLPGLQPELVSRVLALGKPTLLVLVNGATLGVEMYTDASLQVPDGHPNLLAIVESWQPGVGE
jgi:beta-glucosidase